MKELGIGYMVAVGLPANPGRRQKFGIGIDSICSFTAEGIIWRDQLVPAGGHDEFPDYRLMVNRYQIVV
jgi:hypothetical protein